MKDGYCSSCKHKDSCGLKEPISFCWERLYPEKKVKQIEKNI